MQTITCLFSGGWSLVTLWSALLKFSLPRNSIATSAIWNLAEQLTGPALLLLSTPFFLKQLGVAGFGTWMFIHSLIIAGSLATLGAAAATTQRVALAAGGQRKNIVLAAIRGGLALTLTGALLVSALIVAVAPFIASTWLSSFGSTTEISRLLNIAALLLIANELDAVWAGALKGSERFKLCSIIEIAGRSLAFVLAAYAASRSPAIDGVISFLLLGALIKCAAKALAVVAMTQRWSSLLPSFKKEQIQSLLGFGLWLWVQAIGGFLFSAADRLFVGAAFGPVVLADYSIAVQFAQLIHAVPAMAFYVLFPVISRLRAAGNIRQAKINRLLMWALLTNIGASVVLLVGYLAGIGDILEHWVGRDLVSLQPTLVWLLGWTFFFLSLNTAPYWILLGFGRVKIVSLIVVTAGVISLAAGMAGASAYGPAGFVAGRMVYAVATLILIAVLVRVWRSLPQPSR